MIYHGTSKAELIYFHREDDKKDVHFIAMEIDSDEPVFYVRTCCNENWEWKFWYNASNYDMVKHAIWDAMFESENMEEMLYNLDMYFDDIFDEIIVLDEKCDGECDCDEGCNCCNCK